MVIEWTGGLSVGNGIIDSEHRDLISLTNNVAQAIAARDCDILKWAFEMLENQLQAHFASEGKIAHAAGFDFPSHRAAQEHSLRELQYMRNELITKNGIWSDSAVDHFISALKKWMIDKHINEQDMQMKPLLLSLSYGFRPE